MERNGKEKNMPMKITYDRYFFSLKEWIMYLGAALAGYTVLSLLLYDSLWPFVMFPAALFFYFRMLRQWCVDKRKRQLLDTFVPAMEAFVVALRAGYSAESALKESRRDMRKLAGEQDLMVKELMYMEGQMGVSVPLEKLFLDLAERSGVEDIQEFARVFAAGKRRGGELDKILNLTVRHMKQKQETEKDILAEIASRRMEQNVMSLVPLGILLYLRWTSPEYMQVFYTTAAGKIMMTGCLFLYLLSCFWGRHITAIRV